MHANKQTNNLPSFHITSSSPKYVPSEHYRTTRLGPRLVIDWSSPDCSACPLVGPDGLDGQLVHEILGKFVQFHTTFRHTKKKKIYQRL